MSGGHFDYSQFQIEQAADTLRAYIDRCNTGEADEYGSKYEYSPKTMERFEECKETLLKAAQMLQRVDWLISGDDGEETFHRLWEEKVLDSIVLRERHAALDEMVAINQALGMYDLPTQERDHED